MAHEISTQVFVLSGFTPVVVFEGTGNVTIDNNAVPCWFGDSTIDEFGANGAVGAFPTLVGGAVGHFCYPTKIFACRSNNQPVPTLKVRNWF